ncbi:hypothetical protein TNCV_2401761 [Trichonephila clavipes]|nr:hypothetical protein TNCV_2401761 [Trichonephila clavipes]
MSYDYTVCKRSLECLFGLGTLSKIKNPSTGLHIVGAQVPSCREETGRQNDLRGLIWGLYGASLKRDTSFRECTRPEIVKHQYATH